MTIYWNAFGGNAYLALAAEALNRERRPLTPAEMLEVAERDGFLPSHLFGATMHKTLSARLAEHIRAENDRSHFYRTAPATFFLHQLAAGPDVPAEYKKVYLGHLRSKSIRKENVLVAPRSALASRLSGEFISYEEHEFDSIYKSFCYFMDRAAAEQNDSVKQFVTFTLVYNKEKLLIYRRGKFTTTSERLRGQLSVGFGGHVNDKDFDLFNQGGDAFRGNAARELREELFLDELYREPGDAISRARILGYINVDDSPDAEHHIAVLIAFNHINGELPKKGELSINQLAWLDLRARLNDLSDFDLWSGMILRNIYEGNIRLGK
ncbi:MAG: HTH domain-containing protein [Sphingomonas sp.]|uniref:HTH domain-containing protein n=1 Tax=Sphingomonas sp. TaxID=28214 RepID=UPI003F7F4F04